MQHLADISRLKDDLKSSCCIERSLRAENSSIKESLEKEQWLLLRQNLRLYSSEKSVCEMAQEIMKLEVFYYQSSRLLTSSVTIKQHINLTISEF